MPFGAKRSIIIGALGILAIAAAACAHSRNAARTGSASVAAADTAVFDLARCGSGRFAVVRNDEAYSVQLRAVANSTPWGQMGSHPSQDLGWLPAGHTDTLLDVRPELQRIVALPDSAFGHYDPRAQNAWPTQLPKRVHFSCTAATD